MIDHYLADEDATIAFGNALGQCVRNGALIFLEGDLGAGKTTLCRGVLRAFDYQGAVKSPTYTLVEPYQLQGVDIYHFDLYRLGEPEELEYMGIRDYLDAQAICLIEWPQRGAGVLPREDIRISMAVDGAGRRLQVRAATERGSQLMAELDRIIKEC